MRTLGWEGGQNLWAVGMLGNVRWDVNQRKITNRTFWPGAIDQIFVSREGQVWGYGSGVWRFESDKWVGVGESAGLQRGVINDMVQTNDGTIWLATWHGFKVWDEDRYTWEPTVIDQPGQTLVEGPDGTLWFGLTQDGLIEQQPSGKITHWVVSEGLVDDHIKSLLIASNGVIWVGTRDGGSRWDGERWQGWYDFGVPDPDGLMIYKFYETRDGNIWAATSEDLAQWNGESWITYEQDPFCLPNFTLLETRNGNFWAGCPTGLFRWMGSSWREYGLFEGISDPSFAHLIQGSNDILYAKTNSGMYEYIPEEDRWQPFP